MRHACAVPCPCKEFSTTVTEPRKNRGFKAKPPVNTRKSPPTKLTLKPSVELELVKTITESLMDDCCYVVITTKLDGSLCINFQGHGRDLVFLVRSTGFPAFSHGTSSIINSPSDSEHGRVVMESGFVLNRHRM